MKKYIISRLKIIIMNECYICKKPISGRYYVDVFDHKMCEHHHNNDVVHCSSCTGFTTKENPLSDGRYLCSICMGLTLKPGDSIEPVTATVIKALNKAGFDDLRQEDITIKVVSAQKLAEIARFPSINLNNKGITLSSVSLKGIFGGQKKFNHEIFMLEYLNKIEFAGALAHEMLHAWQLQNEISMSPKYTEGLCNMGAYLMWNTLGSSLTRIYLKNLHESPDPIYGDGFREIYTMYEAWGWKELIENVRANKLH